MQIVTQNHGLAGGQLDATKHLKAMIPHLLDAGEREAALAQLANHERTLAHARV